MFKKIQSSLGTKSVIFLCVILFLIFGVITAINSNIQSKFLEASLSEAAERTADFAMVGISYPMLNGDQDVIQMEFDHYRALGGVDVIHLLDHDGIIRRSTDRSLLDKKSLAVNLEKALAGEHIHGVEWRKREGRLIFSELRPIFNAKKCYGCHTAKRKVLGALRVALDWGPSLRVMVTLKHINLIVSLIGLAAIIISASVFIIKIIISPIRKLEFGLQKVAKGDFSQKLYTQRNDEIGNVARMFNKMTEDLDSLISKEKELKQMEQKKSEELAASLSLLSATLESTADGILVVDSSAKRITSYNQKLQEMWDFPPGLIESGDNALALEFILKQLRSPEQFLKGLEGLSSAPEKAIFDIVELTNEKTFEYFSLPQKSGEQISGRVWSFRDITQRKIQEEELKKRMEDLERFHRFVVDRELKMRELKEKITELEEKISINKKAEDKT